MKESGRGFASRSFLHTLTNLTEIKASLPDPCPTIDPSTSRVARPTSLPWEGRQQTEMARAMRMMTSVNRARTNHVKRFNMDRIDLLPLDDSRCFVTSKL
jgi:hypothetical protein